MQISTKSQKIVRISSLIHSSISLHLDLGSLLLTPLYIRLSLMHCDGIEIYSDIGVASTRFGFKLLTVTI